MTGRRPKRPAPDQPMPPGRDRARRGGFSLVESTVATLLLMAAMATTVQAISWIARDRRDADRHALALREAENLLDRFSLDPPAESGPVPLSTWADRALSGGSARVDREPEPEEAVGVAMDRITVTVSFELRPGTPAAPVRLTTWTARDAAPSGTAGDDGGEVRP